MQALLAILLQIIITVAIPFLAGHVVQFLRVKAEQIKSTIAGDLAAKYIREAEGAVSTAVLHVSQTYVDALKESDQFTAENQKEALNRAVAQAKSLLTAEAKKFLDVTYADLSSYLSAKIEAEVKAQKDPY